MSFTSQHTIAGTLESEEPIVLALCKTGYRVNLENKIHTNKKRTHDHCLWLDC